MLSNLLAGYMKANPTVQARMVAAYVIGFSITQQYLDANPHLGFATGPDDTGVIVSYNTEAPDVAVGANPVLSTTGIGLVMNPLSWSRDETYVPANDPRNLGVSPVLKALLPACISRRATPGSCPWPPWRCSWGAEVLMAPRRLRLTLATSIWCLW